MNIQITSSRNREIQYQFTFESIIVHKMVVFLTLRTYAVDKRMHTSRHHRILPKRATARKDLVNIVLGYL